MGLGGTKGLISEFILHFGESKNLPNYVNLSAKLESDLYMMIYKIYSQILAQHLKQ